MDVKTMSVDLIGLSKRSQNALHRAQVHTVGEMLMYTEESLQQIRNLGKKSIEEILGKIEEYKKMEEAGTLSADIEENNSFAVPENFEEWISEDANQELVREFLKEKELKIDVLELLSARAYNILLFADMESLQQIVFCDTAKLMEIERMDLASAGEIEKLCRHYLSEIKEDIFAFAAARQPEKTHRVRVFDMLKQAEYQDLILKYVQTNDIAIERMSLSNRPKRCLLLNHFQYLSDIIFQSREELQKIPSMGSNSVEEILSVVRAYLEENEQRILAVCSGDISALWSDSFLKKKVLDLYQEIKFGGLKLEEIIEKLELPEQVTPDRIKFTLGTLIAEGELEYVDYRCYRVYGKFETYLEQCTDINERSRDFIRKRLEGFTLEAIAQENGLTRERVRQVVKKELAKVRNYYVMATGMELFDEDYFSYLYGTYSFEKKDGTEWLGVPAYVWNYLELNDVKSGKKDLKLALEDHENLDLGLRLKIKNYLNRNKIYVDGMWVEKRRAELERVIVQKFCKTEVSFDSFVDIYNDFLREEEIPYDEDVYYTEAVYRTRKNHLSEARFLLWKQNEMIRSYDIDGRDYSELLDTLNLDSFENIEISTVKFIEEYPEIMEKYDIQDQYELHNLLRKIVPEGSYHDFHCGRMPEIKFGTFDRDAAIFDLLVDNAPISMPDLAEIVRQEYGYDPATTMGTYLQPFHEYYHQGLYSIDQKTMLWENKEKLKAALTEDFYYIDEIRKIYKRLLPNADVEEVNPYNLKTMGFVVLSRYVVQNHASLEAYCEDILTKEDICDITFYKKRLVYVQMFYQKLKELKRNLQIVEFEPNMIITFRKLERSGVTREMIQEFCDAVYAFVRRGEYFSIQSLKEDGFESELYDLGFSDWFYANLLISDDRFSFATMFGNLIFYKGKENITIRSFEMHLIQKAGSLDVYDLMTALSDRYGCKVTERLDLIYKVQGTEVYYDRILDRLYANEDFYYSELDEM